MSTNTWGDAVKSAEDGFEVLPDGPYDFQIKKSTVKPTKQGKPNINLNLVVLSGPLAGKTAFKMMLFDTENAAVLGIRMRELQALDIDPKAYTGDIEQVLGQISQAMVGKVLTADVGHRTWQGQVRNEVGIFRKYVSNASAGVSTPPPVQATPQIPTVPTPTPPPAPVPTAAPEVPF